MSKHIADNLILHELDKSSHMKYDTSLSKQIEVIIIEEVDLTEVGTDIESIRKKLKEREWYWQNNLNTLRQYGGLNVREERSKTSSSSYCVSVIVYCSVIFIPGFSGTFGVSCCTFDSFLGSSLLFFQF